MFKKRFTEIAVAVALTLSAGAAQAVNIAVNGGFETGDFTGWQQGPGTFAITTINPASGTYAGEVSWSGSASTASLKNADLQRAGTPLALGETLNIQFDVRADFGPGSQLNVLSFAEFAGPGATLVDNTFILPGITPTTWTHFDYNVTLGGPDTSGGFSLEFNPVCGAVMDCSGTLWIDNLEVNAVPVPAAVWLFGSGLVGLVGVARRKKKAA